MAEVAGNPVVMNILTGVFSVVGTYLVTRWTRSGRRDNAIREVEAIEKILDLKGALEKNGYVTTELDSEIEKAQRHIANQIGRLFEGAETTRVNDNTPGYLKEFYAVRWLPKKHKLRIEGKSEEPPEVDPKPPSSRVD